MSNKRGRRLSKRSETIERSKSNRSIKRNRVIERSKRSGTKGRIKGA
jgi:hypothetical protein